MIHIQLRTKCIYFFAYVRIYVRDEGRGGELRSYHK